MSADSLKSICTQLQQALDASSELQTKLRSPEGEINTDNDRMRCTLHSVNHHLKAALLLLQSNKNSIVCRGCGVSGPEFRQQNGMWFRRRCAHCFSTDITQRDGTPVRYGDGGVSNQ